jgi:hypothetical protein
MGQSSLGQGGTGCCAPTLAPVLDPVPFEVRDLSEDCDDYLANTFANGADPLNLNPDALVEQASNSRLHVQSVPAEAIECEKVDFVPLSHIFDQLREAGTISGQCDSAHSLVKELAGEPATHGLTLRVH